MSAHKHCKKYFDENEPRKYETYEAVPEKHKKLLPHKPLGRSVSVLKHFNDIINIKNRYKTNSLYRNIIICFQFQIIGMHFLIIL